MSELLVRDVRESDMPDVQRIYGVYVSNGHDGAHVTMEEEAPTLEEHLRRYREIASCGLPYLAAELQDEIVGRLGGSASSSGSH